MNCKPGDLAIIIASKVPANIGRIVEIVCMRPAGRFDHKEYGPAIADESMWEIRFIGSSGWGLKVSGRLFESWISWIPDRKLRPVSGIPVHDEQQMEMPA